MSNADDDSELERIRLARSEARELGYVLLVDRVPNLGRLTHAAAAAPVVGNQPSMGRHLTYSTSAADAAEAGLAVLRGVVKEGDPWPTP